MISICLTDESCCGGRFDARLEMYQDKVVLVDSNCKKVTYSSRIWELIASKVVKTEKLPYEITANVTFSLSEATNLVNNIIQLSIMNNAPDPL